jgi:hypothetical protein
MICGPAMCAATFLLCVAGGAAMMAVLTEGPLMDLRTYN